jgi:aryl-alcohol dehydrogenase-like predicted oxidoreductase
MGFGAMQLPGTGVFGPPKDHDAAIAVLRAARSAGVNHIDTAQFYGPDVANDLIKEALFPYDDELVLVSKVGAARGADGGWLPAQRPEELRSGVETNLRSLGVDQVHVVNLRRHPEGTVPLDEQLGEMAALRDEGLIGGIGLSNVTLDEYRTAQATTEVACVQNAYNLIERAEQDLFDACVEDGTPFVPFFPLGSAFVAESPVLNDPVVQSTAARMDVTAPQVALAWLLAIAPRVLLIPGTSALAHLEENLAAADVVLDEEALSALADVRP